MSKLRFKAGSLYLDNELCEACLPGVNAVALLQREGLFLMLPVQQLGGGGLLLKIINAKGDRVVHATEFFQRHGVDCDKEQILDFEWEASLSALSFVLR